MWWIIGGIALIVLACFLIEPVTDIRNEALAYLSAIGLFMLLSVGLIMPFVPLILADIEHEENQEKACENVGGSYRVIGEEWDGEYYVDIYGCVKE